MKKNKVNLLLIILLIIGLCAFVCIDRQIEIHKSRRIETIYIWKYAIEKHYNPEEILVEEYRYWDGRLLHHKSFYWSNGALKRSYDADSGYPSKLDVGYFVSGQVMYRAEYDHARGWGKTQLFHRNGTVVLEATYKNNELNGYLKTFYPDGTTLASGVMKNSKPWSGRFSAKSLRDDHAWMNSDYLEEFKEGKLIKRRKLNVPFQTKWPKDHYYYSLGVSCYNETSKGEGQSWDFVL